MIARQVGLSCVIVLTLLTPVRGEGDGKDGPPFPRIANVYGVGLTPGGARVTGKKCTLEEVARCDLLIGLRWSRGGATANDDFKRQLAALKQINPHLTALHFACSAPYTHIAPDEQMLAERQPGQVLPWLLQIDGRPIAGWPGTHMLNLAVPGVIQWLAHQTVPPVRDRGYDGVFIDCMGPRFDHWACEIATGEEYTVDANADGQADEAEQLNEVWAQAKRELARRTRELLGDEAVFMAIEFALGQP